MKYSNIDCVNYTVMICYSFNTQEKKSVNPSWRPARPNLPNEKCWGWAFTLHLSNPKAPFRRSGLTARFPSRAEFRPPATVPRFKHQIMFHPGTDIDKLKKYFFLNNSLSQLSQNGFLYWKIPMGESWDRDLSKKLLFQPIDICSGVEHHLVIEPRDSRGRPKFRPRWKSRGRTAPSKWCYRSDDRLCDCAALDWSNYDRG